MGLRNDGRRYGSIAMLLHWLAALCVLCAWTLGLTVDDFPKSWEGAVVFTHISFGLVVLALLLGGWAGGWRARRRRRSPRRSIRGAASPRLPFTC